MNMQQRKPTDDDLMSKLEEAIILAAKSHRGQRDKAGISYVLHPLRLMLKQENPEAMITAVLHDIVEDTDVSMQNLVEIGYPANVIQALTLLTHDKSIPYMEYIHAIAQNDLATQVKLTDLQDNMDISRIPEPSEKDYARLDKYSRAYKYLYDFLN
jgi:(p)ppGpp synthase/HD superfamily hydrolase